MACPTYTSASVRWASAVRAGRPMNTKRARPTQPHSRMGPFIGPSYSISKRNSANRRAESTTSIGVQTEVLDLARGPADDGQREPVGLEDHGAIAIGAVDTSAGGGQPRERVGRRVTVRLSAPDRDDGQCGLDLFQKRRRARRPRPAVGDLQHRHRQRRLSTDEAGRDLGADVGGDKEGYRAVYEAEHERV